MKKFVSAMMCTALCLGALAPFTAMAEEDPYAEHVDLTLYLVGDTPADYDVRLAEVNKILEEEINTTLNVEWLSWAEHDTKYSLLFTGGEDFDFIFTATSWCHYEQTVGLGGFLELTDELIDTYLPDVKATLPEVAWNQAKLNGSIYMVPANFVETNPEGFAYRGDLAAKYGFEEGINTWDDLINFYYACAEDGQYGNAIGATNLFYEWFYTHGYAVVGGAPSSGELVLRNVKENDNTLNYILDMEDFREFCHLMKDMADKGCWPQDVLSSTTDRQDTFLNGTGATMFWNIGTCQIYGNQALQEHPDWDVHLGCIIPTEIGFGSTKYINGGLGVNVASKNIERTLACINLMCTDQRIQELTDYGIEDKDWWRVGENQAQRNPDFSPSNWWGWRNQNFILDNYYENPTQVDDDYEKWNALSLEYLRPARDLDGFTFDSSVVSTQYAAVEAAMGTYWYPLCNGLVDDVDATIEEFKAALEYAGMQDIMDAMQEQVDTFVAGLNEE